MSLLRRTVLVRVAIAIATLFVVSLLLFFGTEALPGDAATVRLGKDATPELLKQTRENLGLNRPVFDRYGSWLSGFVQGDLGYSFASGGEVWALLQPRLENTAALAIATTIFLLPLSFLFGALSAILRDRFFDQATSSVTLVLMALPEFVVGVFLALAFGVWLSVLPAVSLIDPGSSILSQLSLLVLPVIALLAAALAQMIRMVRAAILDVLHSDCVEMARLKGVPEWRVIFSHAFPNAMAATVQITAFNIAYLIGGVIVVEVVFQFAGIGEGMVYAVSSRDLPTVLAIGMFITGSYIVINLIADLIVISLNPRLREAS